MMTSMYLLGARYRTTVVSIIALITVIASFGLPRLEIDMSFDSLVPSDDPARVVYQRVMGEFGSDNKTIIYIEDNSLWPICKKFDTILISTNSACYIVI